MKGGDPPLRIAVALGIGIPPAGGDTSKVEATPFSPFFPSPFFQSRLLQEPTDFYLRREKGEGGRERERGNPCPTFPLFFLAAFFSSLPPRPLVRRGESRKKCFPPLLLAEKLLAPRIRESDKTILFPPLPPRPHTIFLARFLSEIHSTVLLPPFSAAPGETIFAGCRLHIDFPATGHKTSPKWRDIYSPVSNGINNGPPDTYSNLLGAIPSAKF